MAIWRPGIPVLGYFRLFFVVAGSLYFNQVVFGGVNFIVEKKKKLYAIIKSQIMVDTIVFLMRVVDFSY